MRDMPDVILAMPYPTEMMCSPRVSKGQARTVENRRCTLLPRQGNIYQSRSRVCSMRKRNRIS